MTNYILLKDMPDAKPGTVFEYWSNEFYRYKSTTNVHHYLEAEHVENNPIFFKEQGPTRSKLTDNISTAIQLINDFKLELDKFCDKFYKL